MNYSLPTEVEIKDINYSIRTDFRVVLDIFTVFNDPELSKNEQLFVALNMFYPDFDLMEPDEIEEAVKQLFSFINGGESEKNTKSPKLVDWEQDIKYILAPINRIAGVDIRSLDYLHWWTFLSYYLEIGDCLFSQIVNIRNKKARHIRLDKSEQKWYRENRELVDFKIKYTAAEDEFIKQWTT